MTAVPCTCQSYCNYTHVKRKGAPSAAIKVNIMIFSIRANIEKLFSLSSTSQFTTFTVQNRQNRPKMLRLNFLMLMLAWLHTDATFISSGYRSSFYVPNSALSYAFQREKISSKPTRSQIPRRVVADDQRETEKQKKWKEETEKLSDLDARVLQSLLQDDTLDLKSEENLKKMLENGLKKKEPVSNRETEKTNQSEFSSTFFKTLNDNELWNSFTAKAETFVESAKIFVQNRIERDAQLLASIGVFAWERALKDVGRALPSAGKSGAGMAKKMRDSLFLLTNNSSFIEPTDNFILPPSKYSPGVETSAFEELNTPLDEIKSVTEAIRDILAGKTVSQDRGLRSVAPAGRSKSAERQKMAFDRKKDTVLKREKEGIDAKVMRATSTLTDAAWEIKREMEVEGNEAGYRAKTAQRNLEGTYSGFLGGSTNKTFRGLGDRLFGAKSSNTVAPIIKSSADLPEERLSLQLITQSDLNSERERLVQTLNNCLANPSETWLKRSVTDVSTNESITDSLDESINTTELPQNARSGRDGTPAMTSLNEATWESLITTMILARNDIEAQCSNEADTFENEDKIFAELRKLETTVNMLSGFAAASAGYEAAQMLKSELLGDDEDTLLSSLDNLIDLRIQQQTQEQKRTRILEFQRKAKEDRITEVEVKMVVEREPDDILEARFVETSWDRTGSIKPKDSASSEDTADAVLVSEVISSDSTPSYVTFTKGNNRIHADVEFEVTISAGRSKPSEYAEEDDFDGVYASAEFVSEVDEDSFIQTDEGLNSAAFDELSADSTSEPPLITKLALRTIDVVLFVVEKTFTVGLPGIFNVYRTAKDRNEEVRRNGLGKEGWEQLENVNDASKRY